jgi:hypothetical protein
LDYFCHKKIDLDDVSLALVGSNAEKEIVQNSLMASIPGHPFWLDTFNVMVSQLEKEPIAPSTDESEKFGDYVINLTGPNMLRRALDETSVDDVTILLAETHNPNADAECDECPTRHLLTGCWATEGKCEGSTPNEIVEKLLREGYTSNKHSNKYKYKKMYKDNCNGQGFWIWAIVILLITFFCTILIFILTSRL